MSADLRLKILLLAAGIGAVAPGLRAQPGPSQPAATSAPSPAAPGAVASTSSAPAAPPLPRPGVDTVRALLEAEAIESARRAKEVLDKSKTPDAPAARAQASALTLPPVPPMAEPRLVEIVGPVDDLRARVRLGDRDAVVSRRAPEAAGDRWRLESISMQQVVLVRPATKTSDAERAVLSIARPAANATQGGPARAMQAPIVVPAITSAAPPFAPRPVTSPVAPAPSATTTR